MWPEVLEAACRGMQEDTSFEIEGDRERETDRQIDMQRGVSVERDREIETDTEKDIQGDDASYDLHGHEILKLVSIALPCMGRKKGHSLCFRKPVIDNEINRHNRFNRYSNAPPHQTKNVDVKSLSPEEGARASDAVDWLAEHILLSEDDLKLLRLFARDNEVLERTRQRRRSSLPLGRE